ncbi:6215_t:CDS:2 [Diversispora eburnea]|uniref:6215_t:CDS:1 n=1 Tax=Diversispora eburnea TaxID=1213867 RepID=A0A9N8V3W4_9GLOM|nr:6215_t:CDS:2 [Diversispora eburnea]
MLRILNVKTSLLQNASSKNTIIIANVRNYVPLGSHMSDNDPETLEREKKRLLSGNVKGVLRSAPGWNEMLASDSEAVIKAEREPESSFHELQQESLTAFQIRRENDESDVVGQIKQEIKREMIVDDECPYVH